MREFSTGYKYQSNPWAKLEPTPPIRKARSWLVIPLALVAFTLFYLGTR